MPKNLRKSDPYHDMPTAEDDIRPGFLNGLFNRNGRDNEKNRDEAKSDFNSVEKNAGDSEFEQPANGLAGARSAEKSAGGFYSGQNNPVAKGTAKGVKGKIKKASPGILIAGIVVAFGGLLAGAQSMMPFAIQEMLVQKLNSVGVSSTVVSDSWLDSQLNSGARATNLRKGETSNLLAFSPYQVNELKKQNILLTTVNDGDSFVALLYPKGNSYVPVVGSNYLGRAGLQSKIMQASGKTNVKQPISAKDALKDLDFKNPYISASKAWRGGSSGWFDQIMENLTETKLSFRRNRWARYVAREIGKMTRAFKKAAEGATMGKTFDFEESTVLEGGTMVKDADGNLINAEMLQEGDSFVNEDGINMTVEKISHDVVETDTGEEVVVFRAEASNSDSVTTGKPESQLNNILNSKAVKAAGAIADGADAIGAIVEGLMSIYTVVSGYQTLQFINLATGFLEAIDKVKAGDGNESPIHVYSNNFTTRAETIDAEGDGTATEEEMGGVIKKTVEKKTAMESAGFANLFSNAKIDSNDVSVKNVNIESIMTSISTLTSLPRITAKTMEICGYVRIATSATNLIITALSFIPIFGQGLKLAQISFKTVIKQAIKSAFSIAFHLAIPIIAQKYGKTLMKNAATEWFGADLGNAFRAGAGIVFGGNGSSGGQSPGSEEKVLSYLNTRNEVIADEARYQRTVRSPFDISTQYTFLGSLVYSLLPFAYSNSGVMSLLKNASSITTSSLVAMTPTASAAEINGELSSKGECPILETTGAVGDAYCNPYIITDTDTVGLTYTDELGGNMIDIKANIAPGNFNEDGYSIRKGSNLSKYITYCGQRTSQYGIRDAAIAERESKGIVGTLIDFVPVISDVKSLASSIKDANNYKWVTGEACIVSEDNPYWKENKYFARYAENVRLLENMNPGYESAVTAYMKDYYQENPLDNSFEGQIARFSGMTKEKVESTLALIEYYQYLENYRPEERYAFSKPVVEEKKTILLDNDNEVARTDCILLNLISFSDVRNRSFAV